MFFGPAEFVPGEGVLRGFHRFMYGASLLWVGWMGAACCGGLDEIFDSEIRTLSVCNMQIGNISHIEK